MKEVKRRVINWEATGERLADLRQNNFELRRYACNYIRTRNGMCEGLNCENCRKEIDNMISRRELGIVFQTTESVIVNWESGKTSPELEDLLLYTEITGLRLKDILVFY